MSTPLEKHSLLHKRDKGKCDTQRRCSGCKRKFSRVQERVERVKRERERERKKDVCHIKERRKWHCSRESKREESMEGGKERYNGERTFSCAREKFSSLQA